MIWSMKSPPCDLRSTKALEEIHSMLHVCEQRSTHSTNLPPLIAEMLTTGTLPYSDFSYLSFYSLLSGLAVRFFYYRRPTTNFFCRRRTPRRRRAGPSATFTPPTTEVQKSPRHGPRPRCSTRDRPKLDATPWPVGTGRESSRMSSIEGPVDAAPANARVAAVVVAPHPKGESCPRGAVRLVAAPVAAAAAAAVAAPATTAASVQSWQVARLSNPIWSDRGLAIPWWRPCGRPPPVLRR